MPCRGIMALGRGVLLSGLVSVMADAGLAHDGPRVDYLCDGYRPITVVYAGDSADLWLDVRRIALHRPSGSLGYVSADGRQQISGQGPDLVWIDEGGRNWWCVETPPDGAADIPLDAPSRLEGTSWRLLRFRAPEGSGGVLVPPNPEAYQLTFGAQGLLTMQLDCNRLRGSWVAVPLAAHRGTVEFSEGLMTRAACRQGALDARIARDLPQVRSYSIHDGMLNLTLEGSGGSYVWAPLP